MTAQGCDLLHKKQSTSHINYITCISRWDCRSSWHSSCRWSWQWSRSADTIRTVRPISFRSQWCMALCMASKSSMLMWSVFSVVVHTQDTLNAFQCGSQPTFKASATTECLVLSGEMVLPSEHCERTSPIGDPSPPWGKEVSTSCWLKL